MTDALPRQTGKTSSALPVICLTFLICLCFKTESLWTDEAFSAFVACHRSFAAIWKTLLRGDSSDLQMWLYYCYLHLWSTIFGTSELAFRSANLPFIFVYSAAIVWAKNNLFRANWIWIGALSPFVWAYAGDARPYMCIIALSTTAVVCVVVSVTDPRYSDSPALPWFALSAILVGLNLHMLMILLIPPLLVFAVVYRFASKSRFSISKWIRPAILLSPLYLCYLVFLAWTFGRGTSYDYARPDLLSMASVVFRFIGLAGFVPNRHYQVDLGPYLPGMLVAFLGALCAGAIALWPAIKAGYPRTIGLTAAVAVGLLEAFTLSFVFKQQIEVRHLACLFALVLCLLFSGWDYAFSQGTRFQSVAVALMAAVWLISSFRINFLPEYRREDFRAAVAETLHLASKANADIAVVADPAAVAYYGLSVTGPAPCFPLSADCATALNPVPWPHLALGEQATFWGSKKIEDWLQQGHVLKNPRIILISRSRHPMYRNSPWWSALRKTNYAIQNEFHGFLVYSSDQQKY